MAQRKLSLSAIRRVIIAVSGVEEGTSYGTPVRVVLSAAKGLTERSEPDL